MDLVLYIYLDKSRSIALRWFADPCIHVFLYLSMYILTFLAFA